MQRVISRSLLVLLFALDVSGHAALAQSAPDRSDPADVTTTDDVTTADAGSGSPTLRRRPALLFPLYYSVAFLQTADVVTTSLALPAGAREVNPLAAAVGNDVWQVSAVKAASLAVTLATAEYLWKHGHRKTAAVSMVIAAAFQTAVVLNNVSVLRNQPGR